MKPDSGKGTDWVKLAAYGGHPTAAHQLRELETAPDTPQEAN